MAVYDKQGVQYSVISPAGHLLLSAIQFASEALKLDLTITSACDGAHSGPEDPHHFGSAYDVRTHGLPDKQVVLQAIMDELGDTITPGDGGLLTEKFFGWIENEDTPDEHIHIQLRHGISYP